MMSKSIRMRFAVALLLVFVTGPAAFAQEKDSTAGRSKDSGSGESDNSASVKDKTSLVPGSKSANAAAGKGRRWFFDNHGYYEPLISEPRSAMVNVLVPGWSDEFPFSQEPGSRLVWDITLGKEIAIFGYEVGNTEPDRELEEGAWGIGLWVPLNFHVIEDFKDTSAPIVNTDYRFSGMVKFQKALSASSRIGARFQFGHESTHLGDEFSLAARRTRPDFERVNVSYEYWEPGFSYEKDVNHNNYLIFRVGGIGLWRPSKGYYSSELLEPNSRTIARSKRNFEMIYGFQWIRDKPFSKKFNYGPFVSIDTRHKTIYDYNKPSSDTDEDKQLSWNILLGIRKAGQHRYQKGLPDFYFRFYHGVNPNGQLRNQRDYKLLGFGVHFSV